MTDIRVIVKGDAGTFTSSGFPDAIGTPRQILIDLPAPDPKYTVSEAMDFVTDVIARAIDNGDNSLLFSFLAEVNKKVTP